MAAVVGVNITDLGNVGVTVPLGNHHFLLIVGPWGVAAFSVGRFNFSVLS